MDGRMTCACPIWSRGLPAKLAAGVVADVRPDWQSAEEYA
jgi:hypothetical protein